VTRFEIQKARNAPEQTRLATAIGTFNKQQLAGIQRKFQILKQATVAPQQAKIIR
jgi:hypothetical protein